MYIKYTEVPNYLYNSELYLSFNIENANFNIDVGENFPPENPYVGNIEKFKTMFYVYDRWNIYPKNLSSVSQIIIN